jgi:hypothetical protein
MFEIPPLIKNPLSKPIVGLVRHVAVSVVCMIRLKLAALFIPFVGPWLPLKPDPVQTSDPLGIECAVFERLALSLYPVSKPIFGVISLWNVAVTMVRVIRL